MRKQLVIGVSVLALAAWGGVSENSVLLNQGVNHNAIHLIETSQSQIFEPWSWASLDIGLPNRDSFNTSSVHFIVNAKNLTFEEQEFKNEDLCVIAGYKIKTCPTGYVAIEPCPDDASYYKNCIDIPTWCRNNGYNVTSCQLPQYPNISCPYNQNYYKECLTNTDQACKDTGYKLTCDTGQIANTGDFCPYNSSYKKCVCNPCSGYNYTKSEANSQGYTASGSCNSCGTIKYKRTANSCSGYKVCDCGGASGATVCYSGTTKKYSSCKSCCNDSCSSGSKYPPSCSNYRAETNDCGNLCYICGPAVKTYKLYTTMYDCHCRKRVLYSGYGMHSSGWTNRYVYEDGSEESVYKSMNPDLEWSGTIGDTLAECESKTTRFRQLGCYGEYYVGEFTDEYYGQ